MDNNKVIYEATKLKDTNGNTLYPKTNEQSVFSSDGTTWQTQRVRLQNEINTLKATIRDLTSSLNAANQALQNARNEYENNLLQLQVDFNNAKVQYMRTLADYVSGVVGSLPSDLGEVIEVSE